MIHDGDRIMLGLSGGKDSLSLLHILRHLQSYAPVKFELAALTVDPMIEGFHPENLKPHLAELGAQPWNKSRPEARAALTGDQVRPLDSRNQ